MDSMRGRTPSLRSQRARRTTHDAPTRPAHRRHRTLQLEKFEERALMAIGVGQVGITLPDGTALANNAQLHVAPRELLFEFAPGVQVDPNSLGGIQLVRSGGDGTFDDGNDVNLTAGFAGLGDKPNTAVYRFANTPLDDFYRLNIVTAGAGAVRDKSGAALVVSPAQVNFQVDTGAQVVAVVPQPITRAAGGGLQQARDTIEVYFNADNLQPNDLGVKNKDFYQLIFTAGTLSNTDDVVYEPSLVTYDADADKAVLKFDAPLDELGSGAGVFRLRIGNDDQPLPAPVLLPQAQDAGDTFGTSTNLGALGASAQIVSAVISPNRLGGTPYDLPFPGGNDEPGHRDIPIQSHLGGADTSEGVDTVTFNFPHQYGADRFGLPLYNLISDAQKQRTREIFSIYASYLGIQVAEVESDALGAASMGIVTGDVRALGVPQVGVGGVAGGSLAIMNAVGNWGESEYGGGWFTTAMHEIGHNLGLGHAYELPGSIQGSGPLPDDPLFPGTYDLVHGLHIHRPDSIDVDLYKFDVPAAAGQGKLTAEIKAERQNDASLLDSVLTLWALNPQSGKFEIVSRNDDYFGADSFLAMDLSPGTYYLGVSSTGNTNYDPNMSASGLGGRTQGKYDLRLNFAPAHTNSLKDTSGTEFDGDADGKPGGTFNFWFQTASPANTLAVDKIPGAGAGPLGSLTNPFTNLDDALAVALPGQIVRMVGNGGVDGDLNTKQDNFAFQIGLDDQGNFLSDGENIELPRGVTLMVDAGAIVKLQRAPISVGSFVQGYDLSGGALQVLGTPQRSVYFTSLHDETVGLGAAQPTGQLPNLGDWAGIDFHTDIDRLVNNDLDIHPNPNETRRIDYERQGIFLNVINSAVISYAGGLAVRRGIEEKFSPIDLHESRPTLTYNRILNNGDAGISADPNSFEESRFWSNAFSADYDRVGPVIRGNTLTGNTVNGLFIDVTTSTVPGTTEKVQLSTRWDDTDIVHVLQENLFISGGEGGPLVVNGRNVSRPNGRLAIDPNIVVKLGGARIETEIGGQFIAEGLLGSPVIFTSINDDRYGAGGTFDTNADAATDNPQPGDWAGFYFGPASKASLDYVTILFAGGPAPIEGTTDFFNPIEIHQAEVRLAHSTLRNNADGFARTGRNGRGDNSPASIFMIGAQPVIVNNMFQDNAGPAISSDVNSLSNRAQVDYGRTTGRIDALAEQVDNVGPLVRGNRMGNNLINGMVIRGGTVVSASVWDDTDITHVIQGEIVVPNFHTNTGLRLQSTARESLVVKLDGATSGITAGGNGLDISDRIGGTVQVLGNGAFPVVMTGLNDGTVGAGKTPDGQTQLDTASYLVPTATQPSRANISFRFGPNMADNPAAVAAMNQAAAIWESLLDDPINIVLDVEYGDTTGSFIAFANSVSQAIPYDQARSLLIADARPGEALVNQLPTAAQIQYALPENPANPITVAPFVVASRANLQAMGLPAAQLESTTRSAYDAATPIDGTLTFRPDSTTFRWDYDRSDGLFSLDFVATALHEIGHTLGFFSAVDAVDTGIRQVAPTTLDLFRLAPGAGAEDFTHSPRILDPAREQVFYDGGIYAGPGLGAYFGMTQGDIPLSQGINTGDGRQASHWKFRDLIGLMSPLGEMDPVIYQGANPSYADLRAFDLMGYDVVSRGHAGEWRSILIGPNANDRNVGTTNELEDGDFIGADTNSVLNKAQYIGELAANEKAGDDNRRLGIEVYGSIRANAPNDVDLYSFRGVAGTEVWIDIDNSSQRLDSVIELLNAGGQRVAISQDSVGELLGQDLYSVNPRDAGMLITLPGVSGTLTTYFVRVQSNGPSVTPGFSGEQTTGQYRLNLRLRAQDEISGSTVRNADLRFATNGIEVRGIPRHSPLVVESGDQFIIDNRTGDIEGIANNTPETAVNLGNLLGSDRSAIGVAGALLDPTAVNWYKFSLRYQDIQEIAGVNGGRKNWSTIFDVDWADGIGRPDTQISVFQQIGGTLDAPVLTPVLLGRDSDIADDQAAGVQSDLLRGSFGSLDPFIGPAILPAGPTGTLPLDDERNALPYYVAIHSNAVLPLAVAGYFTQRFDPIFRTPNDPRKLFRLEPVSSARRVVEDHIGVTGFGTGPAGVVDVNPTTGPILNIDSAESLRTHVKPFALSDVTLFVSQGGGLQRLVTIDPVAGNTETVVGSIGGGTRPIGDIAIRSDGAMFAYNAANTVAEFPNAAGELTQVDPGTAARTIIGLDGIADDADQELTDQVDDLETVTNFGVGALAFRRFDINADLGINDHYHAYYAVDNDGPFNNGTSRLFLADPTTGVATITPNRPWGPRGDILEFVQGDLIAQVGDENNTDPNILENDGANAQVVTITRPANTLGRTMVVNVSLIPVNGAAPRAVLENTTVLFAADERTATVNINTVDNAQSDGTQSFIAMATGFDPIYGVPLNSVSDRLNVLDDEPLAPGAPPPNLQVSLDLLASNIDETDAPLTRRRVYIAPIGQGFNGRIDLTQPVKVNLVSADDSELAFVDGGGNLVSSLTVTLPAGAQPFAEVDVAPVNDGEKDGSKVGNILVFANGYRSTRTGLTVNGPGQDIGYTRGMAFAKAEGLQLQAPSGSVIRDDHFFTLSDFSQTARFEFLSNAQIAVPAANGIADGATFQIELIRGVSAQTHTLEFNLSGTVRAGNIAIDLLSSDSADVVAAKIRTAINGLGVSNLDAAGAGDTVTLSGDFNWVELDNSPLRLTNLQSGNRPVFFELTDTAFEVNRKLSKAITEAAEDGDLDVSVVSGGGFGLLTVTGANGFAPLNSFVQSFSLPNGGSNLWGVSDAGAIYTIDLFTGLAKVVHVEAGTRFAGLALGPQNLDFDGDGAGGDLATTLFAITENGNLYAFDVSGIDPDNPGPLNNPNFFRSDIWGSRFVSTQLSSVTGLAFSPLDFNLWHPTTVAGVNPLVDAGHGVNPTFDLSRPIDGQVTIGAGNQTQNLLAAQGALSFRFALDNFPFTPSTPEGAVAYPQRTEALGTVTELAQYGILRQNSYLDLVAFNAGLTTQRAAGFAPDIGNNYNLPGGAYGTLMTDPFSLYGYKATDKPTLYFNYFLEGEGADPVAHPNGLSSSLGGGAMRDSARVFVSVDDGLTWDLLATNNMQLDAELPDYLSASSTRPEGDPRQRIQPLFEMEHLNTYPVVGSIDNFWRQARVDLGEYAGNPKVRLRFDFSSAGTLPGDGFSGSGAFGSASRGTNNDFRGFAIDDIVVGFAERGETVTAPVNPDEVLTNFGLPNPVVPDSKTFVPAPRPQIPNTFEDVLTGAYQLEIRRGSQYATTDSGNGASSGAPAILKQIDTNDPQSDGFTLQLPVPGSLRDGDRFGIDDGRQVLTFEFDDNGIVAAGNVAITYSILDEDKDALAQTVAQRINARFPSTVKAVARTVDGIVDIYGARSVDLLPFVFTDPPPSDAQNAMQNYLNNGDPFTPPIIPANQVTTATYRAINLRMDTQTWRPATDVNPSLWKNWVTLIVPNTVTSETALLLITGGGLSNDPPVTSGFEFDTIAKYAVQTRSVAAILYDVPNQPTDILADSLGVHSLSEDALLASSLDQFLRTGDPNWPVLLPMVKSAVRAMDTTQNFVNNVLGQSQQVNDFVVTGFSKRGWTTYLTGANDSRVKAIMPGVYDALHLFEQLDQNGQTYANVDEFTVPDQLRADRRYSQSLDDYVNYQIVNALNSPNPTIRANAPKLLQVVDPYQYRSKLTMPKFLVNAAGDEFFVNDAAQFYIHDLVGPTYLRMVPNAGHSLGGGNQVNIPTIRGKTVLDDVTDSFQAFYDAIIHDEALPKFNWVRNADGSLDLTFDSAWMPKRVVGWTADSANGDFRWGLGLGAQWSPFFADNGHPDGSSGFATHWHLNDPNVGSRAFLVEVEFDRGPGKLPFVFTTEVSVLRAAPLKLDVKQNFGVGDSNRFREQGQLLLEGNRITFASEYGIRVEADFVVDPLTQEIGRDDLPGQRFRNASIGLPAMGVPANLAQLNNSLTVTGVSVQNNVVAFGGSGAIRFAGDPNEGVPVDLDGDGQNDSVQLDGPISAFMFGRIFNNTLYGNAERQGNGIEVGGAAAPTIMNNVISNFVAGVGVGNNIAGLPYGNTVLTANVYKGNTTNAVFVNALGQPSGVVPENFRINLNPNEALFVDGPSGNFSLASGSRAIDASLNSLQDRVSMTTVTQQLGIAQSPILAPDRDLFGQLRIDDPTVAPFPGLGSNVFKDRGAIERVTGAQAGSLQITDVSKLEGSSGVTQFVFTVTLSAPNSQQVSVTAKTTNDTAAAPGDFTAVNQLVTFQPGETVKTVTVDVNADGQVEPDERFFVDLQNANNAGIAKSRGIGTILNDDVGVPSLTIDDVTKNEGTGGVTPFVFTVSLGAPATGTVTVNYTTKDGTAKAGLDYQAASGQLTFNTGDVTKSITVNVFADPVNEANENFTVELSAAVGAQVSDASGIGTILNDDVGGSNVVPLGPEFIVNTTRPNNQEQSDVAMDANGNYVVVWTSFQNGLGDVFGQRYTSDGTPAGGEFLVNTYNSGDQQTPKIAMEDDGNFVVVWAGKGLGRDNQVDESGIFGQLFTPAGVRRGQAFRVNDNLPDFESSPDVATNEDGTFVVAWHYKPGPGSSALPLVRAQRMSAVGDRVGSRITVSQGLLQDDPAPAIAQDAANNSVVVWGGVENTRLQVFGRSFNSLGELGSRFLVNDQFMNEPQVNPAVAAFGTGNFIVAWTSEATQTAPSDTFLRGYQAFSPVTPVRRANTTSLGEHSSADVSIDGQGHVAVTWVSRDQDGDGLGVYGRVFDAAGNDLSRGEFLVNTTVVGNQFAPSIALNPSGGGHMTVTWTGETAPDSNLDVYGQRYLVIFDQNAPAAPVISSPATQSINEGQTLNLAIAASDPNGDALTYRLAPGAPAGASINPTTGQLTWTNARFSTQAVSIPVVVTDNSAAQLSSTTTVLVNVRNVAPSVTIAGPTTAVLDQMLTLTLFGSDPSLANSGAFLTYQIDWDGNGVVDQTVQGGGQAQVQKAFNATGEYNVKVTVLDQAQAAGSSQVQVNVTGALPNVTPVELGTITTTQVNGVSVSGDGLLYHFTTSRSGQLTLEALFNQAQGSPTLRLFNQIGNELAQSTTGNGIRRIDLVTAVGASYFLAVEGSHPSVNLRFTNALSQSGSDVTLFGGNGDDQFVFTRDLLLQTSINGTIYSYPDTLITSITFNGGPGDDTLTLNGSTGNESLIINPGSATWTPSGNAYTVNGVDMKTILAIGGGGIDSARLFDSAGNDNLNAQETQVTLMGTGYVSTVQGFASVRAQASTGLDRADLFDSAGDDQLVARSDFAQLAGSTFFNMARGFDVVRAFASSGNDQATFYDSTGDDQLVARPDRTQLGGAGFLNQATGFDTIRAFASTGNDQATLNDSAGNDQLTIRTKEKQAVMTGTGFSFDLRDFDSVRAFASGGRDTATLYDSDLSDRLLARPDYTQLSNSGFSGYANGFDEVRAYAGVGVDTADIYGSGGSDQLLTRGDFAQLTGAGFLNYAQGFDLVRSYGNGGIDSASLYGTGNDTFDGTAGSSRLVNAQGSKQALDFDTVRAYGGGGTTNATLNDTALNDHLLSQGNLATISGVDYALSVYDFQRVVARASFGTNTRTINAHDYLLEQQGNWLDG